MVSCLGESFSQRVASAHVFSAGRALGFVCRGFYSGSCPLMCFQRVVAALVVFTAVRARSRRSCFLPFLFVCIILRVIAVFLFRSLFISQRPPSTMTTMERLHAWVATARAMLGVMQRSPVFSQVSRNQMQSLSSCGRSNRR